MFEISTQKYYQISNIPPEIRFSNFIKGLEKIVPLIIETHEKMDGLVLYEELNKLGDLIISLMEDTLCHYADIVKVFSWMGISGTFFGGVEYKNIFCMNDFMKIFKAKDRAFTIIFSIIDTVEETMINTTNK